MKSLLIVDIQNDYFTGGRMELVNPDTALANTVKILDCFRGSGLPVIHVQHIAVKDDATFFLPNTEGVKIHERLTPLIGETVIVKHFPNSFYQTELLKVVQAGCITELVVCGMMTHMCIDTTVRAAKDFGLSVTLISDACATKDMVFEGTRVSAELMQAAFMAALSGTFARVVTTAEYCR